MSPVRVVEQAVEGSDGGEVTVRRERNGDVIVTWFCGDQRRFTSEDLRQAIANVDALAKAGANLSQTDSSSRRFFAAVTDGQLYADTTVPRTEGVGQHVDWAELKKALRKAL